MSAALIAKVKLITDLAKKYAAQDEVDPDYSIEVSDVLLSTVHVRDLYLKEVANMTDIDKRNNIELFDNAGFFSREDDKKRAALQIIKAAVLILSLPSDPVIAQNEDAKLEEIVQLIEDGLEDDPEYSLGHLFIRMFELHLPPNVFVDSVRNTTLESIYNAYEETASA